MENTPQQKYRLGRKQERVILTQDGSREVCWFNRPFKHLAQDVVDILNNETNTDLITTEICMLRERVKELEGFIEDISSNYKLGDKPSWKQMSEVRAKANSLINKGK